MLGVIILLAAGPSNALVPLLEAESARPATEFSTCFIQAEERNGRGWAYLPTAHGGTFTDSGARGVSASYWLQVRGAGTATRLRLFAADSGSAPGIAETVEQCR